MSCIVASIQTFNLLVNSIVPCIDPSVKSIGQDFTSWDESTLCPAFQSEAPESSVRSAVQTARLHIVPLTLALNARLARHTPVRKKSHPERAKGMKTTFFAPSEAQGHKQIITPKTFCRHQLLLLESDCSLVSTFELFIHVDRCSKAQFHCDAHLCFDL